ncbi:hypothetical protein BOTNAR_0396g00010 [Botryotinia narcissicola]|uniref:Methyltransferase type 11 domain-containing protein n=1 Tax=Botryotinia narcissicola TaxID=278944 RepID=A0A4Z1HMU0_9HELO|nr:hypothetical protein BOTNAR_0396g00010 [Botryotinia narcissicola]
MQSSFRSHIPPEEQPKHFHEIRDQAWDIRAYPCTGIGAWLVPQLCRNPVYPEILKRVQAGEILIDVGCFLGHDLRRLIYDGAPSDKIYLSISGEVDIIAVTQVIHQWVWEGQVKAAKQLIRFTKGPGSMIVGNQIGNSKAQERHNPESFAKLWDLVGQETGTRWETQAWMRSFEEMAFGAKDGAKDGGWSGNY